MTYGDHTVVLPRDEKLFALYCRNIGYTAADVKRLWPQHCDQTDLRVSTKHFDPVDVEDSGLLRGGIPNAYDGSHGSRSSKEFSIVGRRRDWPKTKVPASTVDILRCDTRRFINDGSLINDGNLKTGSSRKERSFDVPVVKKPRMDLSPPTCEGLDVDKDQDRDQDQDEIDRMIRGPPTFRPLPFPSNAETRYRYNSRGNPQKFTMITDPCNWVSAMMKIDDHALHCGGKLCHDSHRDVHYAGLCGRIRMSCGEGGDCRRWENGHFEMHSQTPVDGVMFAESHSVSFKGNAPTLEYRANVLHAVGETVTSVMPAESRRLLSLLGLKTRAESTTRLYRRYIIYPIVEEMVEREERRIFSKYSRPGVGIDDNGLHEFDYEDVVNEDEVDVYSDTASVKNDVVK